MLAVASLLPRRTLAPSTYSTGPEGMEALYALLRRQGLAAQRWTHAGLPSSGVLVAAVGPVSPPLASATRLARWTEAGHTLVLLGTAPALQRAFHVVALAPPEWAHTGQAAIALPPLRGVPHIRLPGMAALLPAPGVSGVAPLYTVSTLPVALALTRGRGQLWWFGSTQVWDNATLARYHSNLVLAFGLLASHRRIWFDEYRFGRVLAAVPTVKPAAPTRALPLPPQWRPAALAVGLALAGGAWAAGWRRYAPGPRLPVAPSAWGLVEAYARLLRMARKRGRAVP
jgi:hypothetical protein